MKIKEFLLSEENIERDSYIWNMAGSMLMAFQSVIMLMILTRTLGLVEAGVFTIAYANANLFLTIGKYGMRYFQVSDVKNQFTFAEYRLSRIVTSAAMIAVSVAYTLYAAVSNGYTAEKTQVILWMCLFKVVDVIEDVYHGLYQRKNRLDVASKILTLRMILTIIVFGLGLVILRDLLLSLIIATILTTLLFILSIRWTYSGIQIGNERVEKRNILLLLKVCFPLFAGSFLSFYIGNAPKYAIDARLTDELQACYGFIAMPVFVIGLLNNFIFNPMLFHISVLWNEKKVKAFVLKAIFQTGVVVLITIVCMVGAWLIGIPVLSWLYNTDLAPYKAELLILLLGGGFLGLSGLLNAVITIIRYQKSLMWGYAVMAVLAYIFSDRIVKQYEMMGAAALYTILMGGLCLIFAGIFIFGIMRKKD
ncbi:MAG: lipopolysaccharide biosynthesis protein [Dorea sp.]|nr:lipopolysaccharide biosynthesis protein [Dorea sp.]